MATAFSAGFVGRDMAVDLGTANTLVYVRGRGVLVDEPSVVAVHEKTGELIAVGHDAKVMAGRTPEDITLASWPTAISSPVFSWTATTLGSSTSTPRPRT